MNWCEELLMKFLKKIDNFPYEDIKIVDTYPLDTAKRVLRELIENACQAYNEGPIMLSRRKVDEINKEWLAKYFFEVADKCLDYTDEWEYRRMVELVIYAVPVLKEEAIKRGEESELENIRRAAKGYVNRTRSDFAQRTV